MQQKGGQTASRVTAGVTFGAGILLAQAPLEKPLADSHRLGSGLPVAAVLGQPVTVLDTGLGPLATLRFGLGGGRTIRQPLIHI